jgi:hypothetical protein
MTSSTSSSEQRMRGSFAEDRRRHRARRRAALITVGFGGGAMLAAMLLVNTLVSATQHYFPNPFSLQRIQTSAQALPVGLSAPASAARVYVLGSSLVEFGFSPDIFDQTLSQHGVDVRSYNYGYGNADPSIHKLFARRLAKTFAGRKKLDLVVFEFSPFQATRAREQQTGKLDHAAKALLYDGGDILRTALSDHEEAVALFNTRYVRNGIPAEAITNLLATVIQVAGTDKGGNREEAATQGATDQPPLAKQAWSLYRKVMGEWPQASPPGGWFEEHRGGLPPSVSEPTQALADTVMSRLQQPERMQASRKQRLQCCDIESLDFSERMLDDLIAAIHYAQSVSRRVDLLLMPRNEAVISLTEKGHQRLAMALERIRKETGVQVVNFSQRPGYNLGMFLDADHLTLFRGRRHFSADLARYYADDPIFNTHSYQTASIKEGEAVSRTQ